MKNKYITLGVVGTMVLCSVPAFIFGSKNMLSTKADTGCVNGHHVGNHYTAKDPTCVEAGNKEFWACCECHQQFVEEPTEGTWTDRGEYSGTLETEHIAYVAPTGEHDYKYTVVDSETVEGNVDIVKTCSMCGELLDETVYNTRPKALSNAGYTVDFTGSEYQWSKTDENETYDVFRTNDELPINKTSILTITITSDGGFYFDYGCSLQFLYDDFYIETEPGKENVDTMVYSSASTMYLELKAGEKIYFRYERNGAENYNDAYVKIYKNNSLIKHTWCVIEYDSCGGTPVAPAFSTARSIVNGFPEPPTKAGYTFEGWYSALGNIVNDLNIYRFGHLYEGYTFYAHWKAIE